jgi:hypothetical protein
VTGSRCGGETQEAPDHWVAQAVQSRGTRVTVRIPVEREAIDLYLAQLEKLQLETRSA